MVEVINARTIMALIMGYIMKQWRRLMWRRWKYAVQRTLLIWAWNDIIKEDTQTQTWGEGEDGDLSVSAGMSDLNKIDLLSWGGSTVMFETSIWFHVSSQWKRERDKNWSCFGWAVELGDISKTLNLNVKTPECMIKREWMDTICRELCMSGDESNLTCQTEVPVRFCNIFCSIGASFAVIGLTKLHHYSFQKPFSQRRLLGVFMKYCLD